MGEDQHQTFTIEQKKAFTKEVKLGWRKVSPRLHESDQQDHQPSEIAANDSTQTLNTDLAKTKEDHEVLPPVEMTFKLFYSSKRFQHPGNFGHLDAPASDHDDDPRYHLSTVLVKSYWAESVIYDVKKECPVVGAKLSEPSKILINGFIFNEGGYGSIKVEWRREGDLMRSLEKSFGNDRPFPISEVHQLVGQGCSTREDMVKLLADGYGIFAKMADMRNMIAVNHDNKTSYHDLNDEKRTFDDQNEKITFDDKQLSLWQAFPEWIENENLIATIADTYLAIIDGKNIKMVKNSTDNMEVVLVAQSLAQMIAARHGKLITWLSQDDSINGLKNLPVLSFVDSPNLPFPLHERSILINPRKSTINPNNSKIVDQIRQSFSQNNITEGMKTWKESGI